VQQNYISSMKTKKELKQEFKSIKLRVGIYQIINKQENRIYLQITSDLDRAFSSDIFQLKAGMHSNERLQNDWNKLGKDLFEFSVFDELKVTDTATPTEVSRDLKELLKMHLEEMEKKGNLLYNS
jgi:hypothetical protein